MTTNTNLKEKSSNKVLESQLINHKRFGTFNNQLILPPILSGRKVTKLENNKKNYEKQNYKERDNAMSAYFRYAFLKKQELDECIIVGKSIKEMRRKYLSYNSSNGLKDQNIEKLLKTRILHNYLNTINPASPKNPLTNSVETAKNINKLNEEHKKKDKMKK